MYFTSYFHRGNAPIIGHLIFWKKYNPTILHACIEENAHIPLKSLLARRSISLLFFLPPLVFPLLSLSHFLSLMSEINQWPPVALSLPLPSSTPAESYCSCPSWDDRKQELEKGERGEEQDQGLLLHPFLFLFLLPPPLPLFSHVCMMM